MKLRNMIFLALLVCAVGLRGETGIPQIKTTVKPDKATVGTLLEYRVNMAGKGISGITITPPEKREYYPDKKKDAAQKKTGDEAAKEDDPAQYVPLYVIHSIKKEDRSDKTITDITVLVQLSFYRPGTWSLPDVEIKGADGVPIGYKVPTVTVGAVNEKGEFQDIEQPLDLGGNWVRLVFLILGLVCAAVAAFFVWRYIRKRIEERRTAVPVIPPIEIFLTEIEQFGGGRLIEDGKIEEFVFGISMIFRKFLSSQFHFDAMEMTTYEIEKKIKKTFPGKMYDAYAGQIMKNFNLWDLSKFAEFTPTKELLYDSLGKTVDLAKKISGETDGVIPGV